MSPTDCVLLPSDGRLMGAVNAVLVTATLSAPLLNPAVFTERPSAIVQGLVPQIRRQLTCMLRTIAVSCQSAREHQEKAFILIHGALTYACGDLIAQTTNARGGMPPCWKPSQVLWAALIGLVSDTLPFYHWSFLLQSLSIDSPGLRRIQLLRENPPLLVPIKIAVHLMVFQPASTTLYLFLQGLRRSGSVDGAISVLRRTLYPALTLAAGSFAVGGAVVYSLPSMVAQAALRNAGVLLLSIYLALVSSS